MAAGKAGGHFYFTLPRLTSGGILQLYLFSLSTRMNSQDKTSARETALSFLENHPLCTLSTHAADGSIDTATVYFSCDSTFTLYFVTKEDTRKAHNLAANQQITATIADETVLLLAEIKGTATPLQDYDEVASAVTAIQKIVIDRKADYWVPPIAQLEDGPYIVYKITPTQVRFLQFDHLAASHAIAEPKELILRADDLS